MARETKAEREAREAAIFANETALYLEAYPKRLIATLERATLVGFDMHVSAGMFQVEVKRDYYDSHDEYLDCDSFLVAVSPVATKISHTYGLDTLETEIHVKEMKIAEEKRIESVKSNAISKLTEEERKVLGI